MKTLKLLSLLAMIFLAVSCSRDDDNQPLPEIYEQVNRLLTSGKWYLDIWDGDVMPDCLNSTYFEFHTTGMLTAEWFGIDEGNCVSAVENATYELLNDSEVLIGEDAWIILTITQNRLVMRSSFGSVIEFDKTEGLN